MARVRGAADKTITRQGQTLVEVMCIEDVPYFGTWSKRAQFLKGQTYTAQLKRSGNYEIDNDGGRAVSFIPEYFARHFQPIK